MRVLEPLYLAGIFDGEGSFGNTVDAKGYRKLQLFIANDYKPLLDQIKVQFGGGVFESTPGSWQWTTGAADAMFVFLTTVLPHLTLKAKETSVAIAITSTIRAKGGGKLTDQELLVRERLFEMLTEATAERKKKFTKLRS